MVIVENKLLIPIGGKVMSKVIKGPDLRSFYHSGGLTRLVRGQTKLNVMQQKLGMFGKVRKVISSLLKLKQLKDKTSGLDHKKPQLTNKIFSPRARTQALIESLKMFRYRSKLRLTP
jgi:hypothetical protein